MKFGNMALLDSLKKLVFGLTQYGQTVGRGSLDTPAPALPSMKLPVIETVAAKSPSNIIKGNVSAYSLEKSQTDDRWWEGAYGDDLTKEIEKGTPVVATRYYPKGTKIKINTWADVLPGLKQAFAIPKDSGFLELGKDIKDVIGAYKSGFQSGTLSTASAVEQAGSVFFKKIGDNQMSWYLQHLSDKDEELARVGVNVVDNKKFSEGIRDPKWIARGLGMNLPNMLFALGVATPFAVAGAPIAITGAVAVGSAGILEGGFAYREAKNSGADDKTAEKVASLIGIVNGLLEALPITRVLTRSPIGKTVKNKILTTATKRIVEQAIGEAGTESLQEIVSNSVAKVYYDDKRNFFAGVPESAFFGALVGGVTSAGIDTITGMPVGLTIEDVSGKEVPEKPITQPLAQEAGKIPKGLEGLVGKETKIKRVDLKDVHGQYSGDILVQRGYEKIPKERPELYKYAPKTERGVVMHELGHRMENELPDNVIAKFNTIKGKEFHPQGYNVAGGKSPMAWPEDFAESFSKWNEHYDIFKKEFPQRARFFDELGLKADVGKDTAKLNLTQATKGVEPIEVKPVIQIGTKKISMEGKMKPEVSEKLIPKEVQAEADQLKKQFSQDLMTEIKKQGGIKISPDIKEEVAGSVPLPLLNKNGFTIDEMAQQLQSAGFNIQDGNQLMEELSKLPGARVRPSILSKLVQRPTVVRGALTGTKLGRDIEAVGGINSPTLVQDLNELAGYSFKDNAELQSQLRIEKPTPDTNIQKMVRDLIRINTIKPNYGGVKRLINRMTGVKLPERIIERTEMQLLRNRITNEARGAKIGAIEARKLTRQELITKFKDSRQNVQQIKGDLMKYIDENLPAEVKGKFNQALTMDNLTRKNAASIFSRVERLKETLTRKELVGEIKELSIPRGNMAVDYQKKVSETIVGIDLAKPTEATLKKLKGLRDYIQKEGAPLNIQSKYVEKLTRLTQKNVSQLTTAELTELKETLNQLQKLGKLKQDLKYKYIERERKVALDRLLASTQNIDPKVSGLRTKWDTYKVGTKKVYMDTLHTPRVADMIDGFKGYQGENAKLIKQLGRKETTAKEITRATVNSALEEIQNLGIEELTEEQQIRMMINIRYREGAYEQVKTLMTRYGHTEIPTITEQEAQVIDILKKYTNQHTDDIVTLYEEIENLPYHRLKEYVLPLKYEKEFNLIPSQTIEQGRFRTTQTFQGFNYARQKGVEKTPRTDILAVFEEAINEQQWYLKMQPELENIKYLVKSEEYLAKGGEMASNWWRTELDVVARRGWSATAQSNPVLRQGRINLNQAILGYKASSILMQPFAVFDAMAYAQSRYGTMAALNVLKEFSKVWIIPNYAKQIVAESPALQLRQAGELAIEETLKRVGRTKGLWNSFIRKGMAGLQWADVRTAAGVQQGIEKILIKHGVPNAKQEAEFLMNMVSGSNEVVYRPHILASGEGARTWFTFQTFFMNRWGIMIHDLIKSGVIKGGGEAGWRGMGKRISALIGLGIFIAGSIAENEARKAIYELTTGKELPDESTLKTAVMFIPEQVPYFGNLIEAADRGGDADPPLIRTVENIFSGGASLVRGAKPETKIKGGIRMAEAGITLTTGVPGTAQFFDLLENIFSGVIGGGGTGGGGMPTGMPSMRMPSMQMPSMKMPSMKF